MTESKYDRDSSGPVSGQQKTPSLTASKIFANAVLLSAAGFFATLLGFSLVAGLPASFTTSVQVLLGYSLAVLLLFTRAPLKARLNFSIVLVSLGISLLGAELLLGSNSGAGDVPEVRAAADAGVPFDTRSRGEVMNDLRKSGTEAVISITPGSRLGRLK